MKTCNCTLGKSGICCQDTTPPTVVYRVEDWMKDHYVKQVPIRRGCSNGLCNCTGKCNEIIGWRDKIPGEN